MNQSEIEANARNRRRARGKIRLVSLVEKVARVLSTNHRAH